MLRIAAPVQQPQNSTGTDFANFESFGSLNQAAPTNNSNDLLGVSFIFLARLFCLMIGIPDIHSHFKWFFFPDVGHKFNVTAYATS